MDPSNFRPYLKPESLQRGSALEGPEAEGASGGMELALDPQGPEQTLGEPGSTCPSVGFRVPADP